MAAKPLPLESGYPAPALALKMELPPHATSVKPAQTARTGAFLAITSVALLASVTGLLFFLKCRDIYAEDSASYIGPAIGLALGRGFTDLAGHPETLRTPGYPLLIALLLWLRAGVASVVFVQHAMRVLVAAGISLVTLRLTRSRAEAFLAGFIFCIDVPSLESANSILTESLFTFVLGIGLVLLWRSARASRKLEYTLAAALVCGATSLVRPVSLFLAAPAGLFLLFAARRLRPAAVFTLLCVSVPLAWSVRNLECAGWPGFSSISGIDMMHRAAGTLAEGDSGDYYVNMDSRFAALERRACDSLTTGNCSLVPATRKSDVFGAISGAIVRSHPVWYLKNMLRGAAFMMLGGDRGRIQQLTGLGASTATALLIFYGLAMAGMSLAGAVSLRFRNPRFFWFAALVVGYFIFISAGAGSYSRMRVPITPLYTILIARGIMMLASAPGALRARYAGNDRQKRIGRLAQQALTTRIVKA